MKGFSERDRKFVLWVPPVLALLVYWHSWWSPGTDEAARLEKAISAAGSTPEAWRAPRSRAETAARAAADERARAEADFAAAEAELARERGSASPERRSKPGALASLNRAAATSGVTVVSANSRTARRDGEAAGVWDVTFFGGYREMCACLKALSEEPGVMVRSIDRLSAEEAETKPIWKLLIEM